MISEHQAELLDRYLSDDELSPADAQTVQNWLRSDESFREAYRLRSLLGEAARRQRRADWQDRLGTYGTPARAEREVRPLWPLRWAAAASVLIGLVALGWWALQPGPASGVLFTEKGPVYEQLDSQGFALPPGLGPVDLTYLVATTVPGLRAPAYEFARPDTLHLFLPPGASTDSYRPWRLLRRSETEYLLLTPTDTFRLEQGRSLRQPLKVSGGR